MKEREAMQDSSKPAAKVSAKKSDVKVIPATQP